VTAVAPARAPARPPATSSTRPALVFGAMVLLLAVYGVLSFVNDPRGTLGTDTGGKLATIATMERTGSLEPDIGYWAEDLDPQGRLHPLWYTDHVGDDWVNVTTLPMLVAASPLYDLGGPRDGSGKDAKLIGVEYIISDAAYRKLSEKEKKYWHAHTYEVLGGGLIAPGMNAKAETGKDRVTMEEMRPMFKALLADRFGLKTHEETKEMAVYELQKGKNGPKLTATADPSGNHQIRMGRGQVSAKRISMEAPANQLSQQLGRKMIWQTPVMIVP
jgi:hypothetical protein